MPRSSLGATSERLPQADVDFECIAARLLVQGHRDVEPDGTDTRVVAHAEARADVHGTVKGPGLRADLACVDEGRCTEALADALAEFDRSRIDRRAADRRVVGELRP